MSKKETKVFYIITKFPEALRIKNYNPVKKIVLSSEDEEYDEDEFESFDEYVDYMIEEECAADEQHGGNCIVLTPEEFKLVKNFKE